MNRQYSWPVKWVCGSVVLLVLLVCSSGSPGARVEARAAATKGREFAGRAVFQVEVEGRWNAVFNTCSGLGSASEVAETKMGDKGGQAIMKIPGRLRWHDVTLERPLTSDRKVWEWRQEVTVGKAAGARQKCTITMMGPEGKPLAVWELSNAWPLDLTEGMEEGSDTMIEQVRITHEGVTRRQ